MLVAPVRTTTICHGSCHSLFAVRVARENTSDKSRTETGAAFSLFLSRRRLFILSYQFSLMLRNEPCIFLKLINYVREKRQFSTKLSIFTVLNRGNQVLVPVLDAFCADLTVLFQLAQTNWAQCKRLFVSLSHQV